MFSLWFQRIVLVIIFHSQLSSADIFAGEGADRYFTARPDPNHNYGQWGHYPNLYQNPNRPLEPINKYDPRYSAVTPNNYNRYRIEDPGDLRCPEAVKEGLSI